MPARSDAPAFVVRAIGSFSKAGSFGMWVQFGRRTHVSPTRTLGTRAGRGARSRPASEAPGITSFNSTIATYRLSGTTAWTPFWLSYLARAYAEVSDFGEARRCSAEAIAAVATTKERIFEAEVYRVGGEIALGTAAGYNESTIVFRARALSRTPTTS